MEAVKEYLRKHRSRFIKELCTYLRFPSISAQPKFKRELNACAKWISKHCQNLGLKTKVYPTDGHPIVTARTPRLRGSTRPHYLVYGHYDVQPVEPLNLWRSKPFHPRKVGPSLFARGASDNKGQHFAHLKAVEAYYNTGTQLPCDLTFLIEGEEEVGSPNLSKFLRKHRRELSVDAAVISDTTLRSLHHPTLSYALRGICGLEILVSGPSRDLHSGIFGGAVDNPAMVLCQMLGKLRDKNGRIAIPGFYQDVLELTLFERAQLALQPFEMEEYKRFLDVPHLFGEAGFSPVEQCSARPTLEINGLTSGHQEVGGKTIIPAWARAKLTMRLVPRQQPEKIQSLVTEHLRKICPPTVRLEIKAEAGGAPYYLSPEVKRWTPPWMHYEKHSIVNRFWRGKAARFPSSMNSKGSWEQIRCCWGLLCLTTTLTRPMRDLIFAPSTKA